MSLKRRRCLSHDEDFDLLPDEEKKEYEPKYFSHYTMQGCVMECRAEYSFDTCGCLPYYYPEFKNGNITVNGTMCNVEQLECLSNISGTSIICTVELHKKIFDLHFYNKSFTLSNNT